MLIVFENKEIRKIFRGKKLEGDKRNCIIMYFAIVILSQKFKVILSRSVGSPGM
jgi:hypothetical protein